MAFSPARPAQQRRPSPVRRDWQEGQLHPIISRPHLVPRVDHNAGVPRQPVAAVTGARRGWIAVFSPAGPFSGLAPQNSDNLLQPKLETQISICRCPDWHGLILIREDLCDRWV